MIHGQAQVERGFNVNDTMLQPNLQALSLQSQRMIRGHLGSNCPTPASLDIAKGLRESVRKAQSRQKLDQAAAKEKETCNNRKIKAEALAKDLDELKSKKIMLVKVVEILKTDSQWFMLKAVADPKNAHAYAIEAKTHHGNSRTQTLRSGRNTQVR